MSKSRKSTKKNSRTRRKRGGAGSYKPKVETCENLNSQLSRYREYITILNSDDALKWQGMLDDIKSLKVSLSNSYKVGGRRRRGGAPENDESERYRRAIDDAETEAENFYKGSSLSKLDYDLLSYGEDVRSGIDHYNNKIADIKNEKNWTDQKCKDPVEGGRKSRRKRRRRTNKRKSRRKSRRRKSTKKKRRRRRR